MRIFKLNGDYKPRRLFVFAGEKRKVKKGEYYLSGAYPEVYQAPNDLNMVFHIMKEIHPPEHVTVDGFKYKLDVQTFHDKV